MKYRKKPIVIEAIQYRGKVDDGALKSFIDAHRLTKVDNQWEIKTLEGPHKICEGDYIIKGVRGEFYPCKPDIFELSYESIEGESK